MPRSSGRCSPTSSTTRSMRSRPARRAGASTSSWRTATGSPPCGCAITAAASRPRSSTGSSTRSSPPRRRAPASGWRSRRRSSRPTRARSRWRARSGAGPSSRSCCRCRRGAEMQGRILVVDDEKAMLLALKGLLTKEGYHVETTVSGAEALRQIETGSFHVVITVLIRGASGTGKELVANALHYRSPRRAKPLVKMNCAALSQELVESELFGHERGAFTGAIARREGKFEAADGGTLFLDEVGDMPLETQAKLLRAIQEKEFERVGGNLPIRVDVRLIAATNQDLESAVRAGRFREDLYYRLRVVELVIPPLVERREDIPLLIDHFLKDAAARFGRDPKPLTGEALRACVAHERRGHGRRAPSHAEHGAPP